MFLEIAHELQAAVVGEPDLAHHKIWPVCRKPLTRFRERSSGLHLPSLADDQVVERSPVLFVVVDNRGDWQSNTFLAPLLTPPGAASIHSPTHRVPGNPGPTLHYTLPVDILVQLALLVAALLVVALTADRMVGAVITMANRYQSRAPLPVRRLRPLQPLRPSWVPTSSL